MPRRRTPERQKLIDEAASLYARATDVSLSFRERLLAWQRAHDLELEHHLCAPLPPDGVEIHNQEPRVLRLRMRTETE